jgi:hypothetical protein
MIGPATLVFGVGQAGGLLIRSGRRGCVTVELTPDAALARAAVGEDAVLPWSSCDPHGAMLDPSKAAWQFAAWRTGKSAPSGVAIAASGRCTLDLEPVRRWLPWYRRIGRGSAGTLPVLTATLLSEGHPERDTLQVLTMLLVDQPATRAHLGDGDRVTRLAADLKAGLRRVVPPPGALRRDAMDVQVALRLCGYSHRYGRPLRPAPRPPFEVVVEHTRERIQANPYREGRELDDALLRRVARDTFYDVRPWPFGALID